MFTCMKKNNISLTFICLFSIEFSSAFLDKSGESGLCSKLEEQRLRLFRKYLMEHRIDTPPVTR